jgi:small subunit ribosomal protein S18
MKQKRGAKGKDSTKKVKKKTSILVQERVEYVDYKDVNLLQRFVSDRSKIRARRVSGNNAQQQRDVAQAIKNAREMALLPYTKRVTTQRTGGRDRDRERATEPQPAPAAEAPAESTTTTTDAPTQELDVVAEEA